MRFYDKEETSWKKPHNGKIVMQTFCEIRFLKYDLIRAYPIDVIKSHTKSAKGMIP